MFRKYCLTDDGGDPGGHAYGPDRLRVFFDDPAVFANAGLILVATLTARLGLEALVDATVRLGRCETDRTRNSRRAAATSTPGTGAWTPARLGAKLLGCSYNPKGSGD